MDDQKRWIQKAFLRPGHRFDAGPRPPLSASNDGTSGETPATLPGPSLRRGPAHGPVLPLAEVKPGARELCRREPFVFDRSAGREPCENHAGVLWHVRAPSFSVHSRSFPSCGICPPAVVIAPRVETSDPGQSCGPFPSLDIPGKGAPGPPRGPCRPILGVGFRHPHPPFWPKNRLFGG
jgi:hypothetical protein